MTKKMTEKQRTDDPSGGILLLPLTGYILLHGINSADFSKLYILQQEDAEDNTDDE